MFGDNGLYDGAIPDITGDEKSDLLDTFVINEMIDDAEDTENKPIHNVSFYEEDDFEDDYEENDEEFENDFDENNFDDYWSEIDELDDIEDEDFE